MWAAIEWTNTSDVLDVWRLFVVSLSALASGLMAVVVVRLFHNLTWYAVSVSFALLMLLASIEQVNRFDEPAITWRLPTFTVAVAASLVFLVSLMRKKVSPYD